MSGIITRIIGTGSELPEFRLTNEMLSAMVDTSDEWITTRTGIKERRIELTRSAAELGAEAAKNAMRMSGITASEIDFIIVSTATSDHHSPSAANIIQGILGVENAFSFDVIAGCTGFIFAMDTADLYIKSGKAKCGLVIASELLSHITDYNDRSTCVLFGDGAGAVVVRADSGADGILTSFIASDCTEGRDKAIYSHAKLSVPVFDTADGRFKGCHDSSDNVGLVMNGRAVYEFVVRILPEILNKCTAEVGVEVSELDHILFHQANKRIIDSLISHYDLDPGKVPVNISKYANTSSATIPILLDELTREGRITGGQLISCVGFGAGLTYGANIIKWRI